MNKYKNILGSFLLSILTISCTKEPDKSTKTFVYGTVSDGNTGSPLANAKVYAEFDDFFNARYIRRDSTKTDDKGYYEIGFLGGKGDEYSGDTYIRVVYPDTIIVDYLNDNGEGSAIQKPVFGGVNEVNFVFY